MIDGRLPDMTPMWESRNSPGLFFAGTLMQARDFRQASSAFIDGFRYNIRTLFHHLEERYAGVPSPRATLPSEPDAIASHILERVCRASSLWTQFGHLADVLVPDGRGHVDYLYDLPVGRIEEGFEDEPEVYTVTLEWGRWEGDVFAIDRHPDHTRADASVFLHPIVRRYRYGVSDGELHMLEDLLGVYGSGFETGMIRSHNQVEIEEYHRRQHDAPLRRWLSAQLARRDVLDASAPAADGVDASPSC